MSRSKRLDLMGAEPDRFQPLKVLTTREVYVADPWIRVSVQQVRLPNGSVVDDYHQITFPEYAVVFAQTPDGEVVVERQYKHGVGRCSLVLPSGLIEKDEEPLAGARRELLEETGYASDDWEPLGSFTVNGNYGCGKAHLFMARNAYPAAEPHSGDLEDMDIITMRPKDLVDAAGSGDVALLGSIAAVALATNPLFADARDVRSRSGKPKT